MNRNQVLATIKNALSSIYGLCIHDSGQSIPPPARECSTCIAEEISDALERELGIRWER